MVKYLLTALSLCFSFAFAKDELSFASNLLQVKVAAEQDVITVVFPFKNISANSVKLGKIVSTCDCTNAAYQGKQGTLNPGESGAVQASMQTGTFSGVVEKDLIVHAGDSQYKLTIKAIIPEIVKISPKKLEWKFGEAPTPKSITVTLDASQSAIKLTEVSLEGSDFDYEPVTVKAGREYKVVVTPKSTQKACFNSIWILTDSTVPRYSKFLGFLAVTPKK